jgi:segregation and condensation protein A
LHKSSLVGIFLAVLELVRHHRVRAEQNELFGEVWILPSANADANEADARDWQDVNNYEHKPS